jgi:uroporphyrinogen-III synthase
VAGLRIAVQEYGVTNAELLEGLRQRGAAVSRVPVYRWALPEDTAPLRRVLDAILAGDVDVVLFTNAVQVDHVLQLLTPDRQVERFREVLRQMVVVSVGPIASERLRSFGLPVDFEPSHSKMGILVKETAERAGALLATKPARSSH